MAGGAAGGFISRAFESMLKECSGKKFAALQTAVKTYLDSTKEVKKSLTSSETNQATTSKGDQSSVESGIGPPKNGANHDSAVTLPTDGKQVAKSPTITAALANAGHVLDGADSELVLNPLRLAFETKNIKVVELALDCLHKLIAYDHLECDPGLDGGKDATMYADMLNMVCGCVDNSSPDSTILQVLKVLLTAVSSTKFRVHGEPLLGVIRVCYNIALKSKSPVNQMTSKAMLTQMISIVFRRMETDLGSTSSGSTHKEAASNDGFCANLEETLPSNESMAGAISAADTFSVNEVKDTSVEELHNLAGASDIKGLEAVLDKAINLEDGKRTRGIDLESMDIAQRDALLLFRTLCNMSIKEDSDEVTTKTCILSLELLQGLVEGVSHSFTKNFNFIDSVKAYLSYALLRASISQSPAIFQYASGIFFVLLLRFRECLKGEIGIFFPLIILRSLEGTECPLNQKLNVIRMLEKVCKDSQMLVDIYVNYDCDLQAPNLFERMVVTVSKIAQGTQNVDPNSVNASQIGSIKESSVQCLVSILKSLAVWEKSQRDLENQRRVNLSLENGLATKYKNKVGDDLQNNFEKSKAHKSTLEAAIATFNENPGWGIKYLISNKLVDNTPGSVAEFLQNTPTLSKVMIGDYMGQPEDFPLAVMHAYVDSMKFRGMKFGTAIREFLRGFRLPGEAQKIDRIMEKFAERYCADNPSLFKNADTAYVLAYAVIMLNSDAHNPMVWHKLSKTDFIQMNTSNDAEECAPTELLAEIYDSVVNEEIKMKDDSEDYGSSSKQDPEAEDRGRLITILNLALPKSRSSFDNKSESEAIIKKTQAILRNQGPKRGVLYISHQIELVRPMVKAVGWPSLATFSVIMEEGENKSRVVLCMEGFKAGIHLTHVLGMDTMRYAFLTSLLRFNFLHVPKDMRNKNVEALRTLLDLCHSDTGALQDTWNAILECFSRLDFLAWTPAMATTVMQGSTQISKDAIFQSLRELAGKPVEQVFVNSVKLPSESVVEFFTALCNVSAQELRQTPARVFSLQKLVEISYYNMARIRMVWARIWSVLANHFISAGSHRDEKIAVYAIDSLRQLGMKYLERSELNNFTYQNDILKPFVILMRSSQSESIRRLIVDCIVHMIKSEVGSIKSGWRSIFFVFTAAAADELEPIIESAFENVEQVILEHFDQVVGDCFINCVDCLIGFANNKKSHSISLKAIALLRICEDRLSEGLLPGGTLKPIVVNADKSLDITEHYWFPMLAGLSDLTSDSRPEVRSCALEVLFDLLNERGSKFSSSFWEKIFNRVLFPIFDHVRHAGKENLVSSENGWPRESTIHSLQLLCNLFNTFYKEVSFMLPPLLSLLLDCAKKTDQSVVSICLGALVHLIEVGGHQFSEPDWDTLLNSIRDASCTTQPLELLNTTDFENQTVSTKDLEVYTGDAPKISDTEQLHNHETINSSAVDSAKNFYSSTSDQDMDMQTDTDAEGLPSPSGRSHKHATDHKLQRSETFGQRMMGNMKKSLIRSFTFKSKTSVSDVLSTPSKLSDVMDPVEAEVKDEESIIMGTIRSKCITQLLLLGAIDSMQKKYWAMLKTAQKIKVMDILFSILEFAASYNSYTNLRLRMQHISAERPPLNLLRQELAGTCIYLDVLQKSTGGHNSKTQGELKSSLPENVDASPKYNDDELMGIAEAKLVSFCAHVLREASHFQSNLGETTNMNIHLVLELRSPVIVKVLKGMHFMNKQIFRKHLIEFYPLITKLICCDQMDIREALADLLKGQLQLMLL
ncbi:hypothetical protein DCAR_0727302 [Daucus carota subsp. sativus]|uniref:SEC7 domain-containing protein n=1 Tax=Daucus carota subsp. sativus TaxID=79200 RepID=A0A164SUM6_DAUCS|nr:hypothetical protein DCAR_0727302 [Daucus carota subsp. sativus]